jgi:hypothetical protein
LERIILANEDGISRHDLTHLSAVGMYVLIGEPPRSKQEFEPRRPRALCAEFAAPQEIPLGHDADEIATGVEDGEGR